MHTSVVAWNALRIHDPQYNMVTGLCSLQQLNQTVVDKCYGLVQSVHKNENH